MLFAFQRKLYSLMQVPCFKPAAYGRGVTPLRSSGRTLMASALNRNTFPLGARYTYTEFLRPAVGFMRRTTVKPHCSREVSESRIGAVGCRRETINCIFFAPQN